MSSIVANLLVTEILEEITVPETEQFPPIDPELEKRIMKERNIISFTNPNEDGTKTRYVAIRADI